MAEPQLHRPGCILVASHPGVCAVGRTDRTPTPDRTAPEGLVEALAGALVARWAEVCEEPPDAWMKKRARIYAEALAPAVVTLMTEHAAEVAGEAREQGVRQAVEWLRADYEYGTGPDWRENGCEWILDRLADSRAALRAGGEGGNVPSARSAGAQAAQEASGVAEGQDGTKRACSAVWGSHACDWLTQSGHTLHRCGVDDPCSEYDEHKGRVRYWDDTDNGLGGYWGPWLVYGQGATEEGR